MKIVQQLHSLWLCLACGYEAIKRDMDKTQKAFIKTVVSIGVMDTDLKGTLAVNGTAAVSFESSRQKTFFPYM